MSATAETYIADAELEKQIAALRSADDSAGQGRALALLTVLLSRCSEDNFSTVAACIPTVTELASTSEDQLVQVGVHMHCLSPPFPMYEQQLQLMRFGIGWQHWQA
jgi:hypothetical protein